MPTTEAHRVEEAALNLSARERARLAERLLRSLDDLSDVEADAIWAEEAEHRDAELERGETTARLAEDVLRDARARFR